MAAQPSERRPTPAQALEGQAMRLARNDEMIEAAFRDVGIGAEPQDDGWQSANTDPRPEPPPHEEYQPGADGERDFEAEAGQPRPGKEQAAPPKVEIAVLPLLTLDDWR